MAVDIAKVRDHMSQVAAISTKYMALARESDAKLGLIMETAKSLQDRMEPLNQNMEQLQIRRKNLDHCLNELSKVQLYHRTGQNVQSIIYDGPTGVLERYIQALDRLKDAMAYFQENNPDHVEYSRLCALYAAGWEALEKEFEGILSQNFPPVNPDQLFKALQQEESSDLIRELEDVAESVVNDLNRIVEWSRANSPLNMPAKCVSRYCDYRRENLRRTLTKLREYYKNPQALTATASPALHGKPGQTSVAQSWLIKKRFMSKKTNITRDGGHKRQTSDIREEMDDVDVDLYSLCLVAIVKLMQNERHWLDRLNLAPTTSDKCGALDAIISGAANDILSEGSALVRMMTRAQVRNEYNAVISLISVLKRFEEIKSEFSQVLKLTMEGTAQGFTILIGNLQQQSKASLELYIESIKSDKAAAPTSSNMPQDGTVHELATTTLMFLENLLDFGDLVGSILGAESSGPGSSLSLPVGGVGHPSPALSHRTMLDAGVRREGMAKRRLGQYIVQVIQALFTRVDRMSDTYSDEILKVVFQMNNLQYTLKTVQNTQLKDFIVEFNKDAPSEIGRFIEDRKLIYIKSCSQIVKIPDKTAFPNTSTQHHGRNVDSKEKAHIKDLWTDFNNGVQTLTKVHSGCAFPDRELRESLQRELTGALVPRYRAFRERFIQVPFTGKKDKYIKYTPEDLEARIAHCFVQK